MKDIAMPTSSSGELKCEPITTPRGKILLITAAALELLQRLPEGEGIDQDITEEMPFWSEEQLLFVIETKATQRPTRRELIIECLSNRLWESSPEAITQILQQLPDEVLNAIAAKSVQLLEMGGTDETQNSQAD